MSQTYYQIRVGNTLACQPIFINNDSHEELSMMPPYQKGFIISIRTMDKSITVMPVTGTDFNNMIAESFLAAYIFYG